jgi:hypothetical protein
VSVIVITPRPWRAVAARYHGPEALPRLLHVRGTQSYNGSIEVEICRADIWSRDGDAVLTDMVERLTTHVA